MRAQPRIILPLVLSSLIACPRVFAQQDNSSSAPAAASAPSPAASNSPAANSAPAKKLWTNEDFGPNASSAPHSAPRGNANSGRPTTATPKRQPQPDRVKWYRQQLSKLVAQTADIDDKIAKYQSALRGETQPSAGLQEYHMHRADWRAEIDKLQKQRQDLDVKIANLEDAARHEGIEPGQLR
jgi:hypothetical protein